MARIVIIGAGLTGLSAAYHLERHGFFDYELFEKESISGGLCRSVNQDGFTFDYTGHLLHINDEYFHQFIEKNVGFDQFNVIHRKSFVYSQDTFTKFPYQVNLYGLPIDTITECIEGYVNRNLKRTYPSIHPPFFQNDGHSGRTVKKKSENQNPKTFVEWVLANFGPGFAKHFFYPYQGKIFAYDIHKLTSSWTGRFVPQTSLKQIIQGAIREPHDEPIGYNAQFFYPKHGGIQSWVHKIANHLIKPIRTQYCVSKINVENKTVHFTNGHIESYQQLINTIPLDTFLGLVEEKSDTNLKHALKYLKCNSVVNFNIGMNVPNITDKHWVYFPETKYPFYRIGFSHNFATSMAPVGCSSLYGEFAHFRKSPEWIKQTLNNSLRLTKDWLKIDNSNIITQKILNISHAYVIYDAWRDKNVPLLHAKLNELDISSIGRYGAWKYSSMQEAVLDGKEVAEDLILKIDKNIRQNTTKRKNKEQIHENRS